MSLPTFLGFVDQKAQLDEAFNSAPYELTFGKKSAGDIFFTFVDEDEKEFRIQFYTPQGLGKNVRQVFIGQKKGSVYPDAIARFKNPMRVIASMIEATKQYLATPLGKSIDGFAVNFSKKALERGMALIPKIIRQSGLKQKLNVMDLTYAPVPDRGYVWLIKKGKDPAKVFDGPKMQGVTWDDPDKIGDIPDQAVRDAALQGDMDDLSQAINRDWNIGIMSKTAGIESTTVKVDGDKVVLGSKDTAIIVKDRAFAVVAKTQSIAQVTVFDKEYNGRGSVDRKLMAASDRQGMGWELKSGGKVLAYIEFGVGAVKSNPKGSGPVDTSVLPTEGTPESLRADGYIARLLGIVDTYAPQMVGMYSGEKLTRTAAGKYRTSGGLDIQVYFWGINNSGQLSVEVGSELSGHDSFTVSGDTKAAAMEIVNHISQAADSQFSGEVEVKSVPMNGAPYPIKRISHSQGYAFVDCDSFVLKISDALLSRFTVGKAVELDLMREFPRTTFPVRYSWRNKESLVVYAGDGKTIFGDINTKANAKDAIVADNLKKPRNGSFTGESINGFTVMWDLNFPRGSKYEGANLFTNYTVYHDKKKVTVTHMVVKNGSTLNNPKSYEIDMTPASVQSSIDDFSKELETVANQFGTLGSNSYNPNQLFLDDIEVTGYGEFLFQGRNLKQSANRDAIISALAKAPQKDSSGTDLATYLASIEKSAPKGRDIDWQFNASRDGQSINLYWDITFRRNNRVGAFNEFRAQVNAANNYVQQVYNDAKAKGYKPDMPNLMTLADAQRSDQMAYENGDSDYSEYEQSIGGGLVINAK